MTFDISSISPAPAPSSSKTTAKNQEAVETSKADQEKSLRDEINEVGFRNYVEEIHKKKLEELREKILKAMGLDEEKLAEMPGEQRNKIEEMISREIVARMEAERELQRPEPDENETVTAGDTPSRYELSADGKRILAQKVEEKNNPFFVSFFA